MVESVTHDHRELYDRRVLEQTAMKKSIVTIDPGLEEIARWETWFRLAHAQRLADLHLPPDQHAKEAAEVETVAAAVVNRMREDYRAGRSHELRRDAL